MAIFFAHPHAALLTDPSLQSREGWLVEDGVGVSSARFKKIMP